MCCEYLASGPGDGDGRVVVTESVGGVQCSVEEPSGA